MLIRSSVFLWLKLFNFNFRYKITLLYCTRKWGYVQFYRICIVSFNGKVFSYSCNKYAYSCFFYSFYCLTWYIFRFVGHFDINFVFYIIFFLLFLNLILIACCFNTYFYMLLNLIYQKISINWPKCTLHFLHLIMHRWII